MIQSKTARFTNETSGHTACTLNPCPVGWAQSFFLLTPFKLRSGLLIWGKNLCTRILPCSSEDGFEEDYI